MASTWPSRSTPSTRCGMAIRGDERCRAPVPARRPSPARSEDGALLPRVGFGAPAAVGGPATGLSKNFWGRAVGWYLMAAVDVLDYLPKTHRDRAELIRVVQQLADAVAQRARSRERRVVAGARPAESREELSRGVGLGDVRLRVRQRRAHGLSVADAIGRSPTRAFDGMIATFVSRRAERPRLDQRHLQGRRTRRQPAARRQRTSTT